MPVDMWQVTGDSERRQWQFTGDSDSWQVTVDRWQLTGDSDSWQVTGEINKCYKVQIVKKIIIMLQSKRCYKVLNVTKF